MLQVDFRDLRKGPAETAGELSPTDPVFEGVLAEFDGPVQVVGTLQGGADRSVTWRAAIAAKFRAECRRCLAEVVSPITVNVDVIFSPDPETADDPAVYPLIEPVTTIDVTPAVREELVLGLPSFVLCRDDCAGLCQRCGADLNLGLCGCAESSEPARGHDGSS